jgi:tetratricopeptide (TPR) repeat protein
VALIGLCLMTAGPAQARNPHCSGGIQYLIQWKGDKDKGNLDDYRRELMKSIQQLEMCATEDPADFEALGYLGWSYAEADSTAAAGRAFAKSIEGLKAKGDKKKIEMVETNRDSYWSIKYNAAIEKIKSAQDTYDDFCKKPENDEQKGRQAEAKKKYDEALKNLTQAVEIKPGEMRTLKNIGKVWAWQCEYTKAADEFRKALTIAPSDTELVALYKGTLGNMGADLLRQDKFDEAITLYNDLLKADPKNPDLHLGLAEAYFKRASTREGDARKADYKSAGDGYAKASEGRPSDPDLAFNAALSYREAREWTLAETYCQKALKVRPNDAQVLSMLAETLAEQKKFEEAIKTLHQAVVADSKNKTLHRQLGSVYTKAGNNQKGTEELMVYLALQNGQPVADAAAQAKKAPAGSQAAKTLASTGVPEEIYPWTADGENWETWFYWSKRTAHHFRGGALVQKSDWTTADLAASGK